MSGWGKAHATVDKPGQESMCPSQDIAGISLFYPDRERTDIQVESRHLPMCQRITEEGGQTWAILDFKSRPNDYLLM